jgi:hypothetical protein
MGALESMACRVVDILAWHAGLQFTLRDFSLDSPRLVRADSIR